MSVSESTYSASLHQLGEHYDGVGVLLPDHSPKVIECGWQWALGGYVGTSHAVALCRGRERGEEEEEEGRE